MQIKENCTTVAPAPFPGAVADDEPSPSPSRPDTPDHQDLDHAHDHHHHHGRNYSIVSIASSCQSSASHFQQDPLAVTGDNQLHHRHLATAATIDSIVSSSTGTTTAMVNNLMTAPLVLTSDIVKSP
ncbi:hypothetical protein PG996_012687 [Apiospora saccharicola]|uniref:Uncharacterized protein n=1 Tax=Apiospora saccharicola TaxID=335842 RepID=A0ABR1U3B7_9PEZI